MTPQEQIDAVVAQLQFVLGLPAGRCFQGSVPEQGVPGEIDTLLIVYYGGSTPSEEWALGGAALNRPYILGVYGQFFLSVDAPDRLIEASQRQLALIESIGGALHLFGEGSALFPDGGLVYTHDEVATSTGSDGQCRHEVRVSFRAVALNAWHTVQGIPEPGTPGSDA